MTSLVSKTANFKQWTQTDWINFFTCGDHARIDRSLQLSPFFQQKLLEIGVFGGSQFLERVPSLTKSQPNPYPIARIITQLWGQERQYLLFQDTGEDPICLEKCVIDSKRQFWSVTSLHVEHQYLSSQPALFARVTAIAGVDRVAKGTLRSILPLGVTRLALEYAGYPQTSRVRGQEPDERSINNKK